MKRLLAILCLLLPLAATAQAQQEAPTWESLNRHPYPQWFADAKLGIFVHWGLYSVPAYASKEGYAEWLYRGLMARDTGRMRAMSYFADTTLAVREMYGQLAHHWHAEMWQPAEWARLFKAAGARYVLLVTKHHDGYSLWDDPYAPEWNSTASGPRRNIVEELTAAVRAEGLRMGFYYSLPEWSHPLHRWTADPDSAISPYVDRHMVPQLKSLVLRYRPEVLFADGDWDFTAGQLRSVELIDWYYRTVGPDAIVNDRWGKGTQHGFRTPEYSAGIADTTRPWAECRGVGRSFGLNRNEELANYLTPTELIQHFCELVAHGGGLTLNVGPAADGHIPLIQQERLLALGHWLEVNGEAIYGSRPWRTPCQRVRTEAPMPEAAAIDFDWVRNAPLKAMPVDHFGITWMADVEVPEEGDYVLRLEADDEATLWSDTVERLLHHNHAWADNPEAQRSLHLDQGPLRLTLEYGEKELEAALRLSWSRDGGASFTPIPARWRGTATWERTTRCFTRQGSDLYLIEFERPGRRLKVGGLPPLPRGAVVNLLGASDPVGWKQRRDGTLTLDLSALDPSELNALDHAWVFRIAHAIKP